MDSLGLVGKIAGGLAIFIWKVFPTVLEVVWDLSTMVYENIVADFQGWPRTAHAKANEWTQKLMKKRTLTLDKSKWVWWVLYTVAFATLVAGWIVPPLVAIWVLGRIF